ncbi:LysR family transcriptional regulator [Pseudonocardia xinjiangensis]|uniref:LysR family transcriptional regulator n=1 Tax=Pseudonocardia xinjiangensis TaxID=75289 RepID=UPI003D8FC563
MHTPLELRLLRYFVAVAEELHFGRAAARLHIAQPSLSVQIRKLEHNIGTVLLLRTSRHVELTAAGEVLLVEARRLLDGAERAAELTRAAAHGARGSLVVGFQANAAAELTPRILSAFQIRHPGVQVEMRSHDFSDPYVGLATGTADVAFVRPPLLMQDWLALETLFVEPRVLVVSSDSALAEFDEISLEQVADQPFVARRAPEYWRDFWLATDCRDGRPVRLGAEVTTVDECFEAILACRGMAFTQASTQRFYDRPGLAFIPVRELPASPLSVAWRKDMDAPLVRGFVEAAREAALGLPVPAGLAGSVLSG